MLLEMRNIVKTYGNVVANNKVNINLNKGEILAVVGENGAGKSTIMKILYGLERPDSGEIFINGNKMNFHNPSDAMQEGIGMVQQHFMLFESMTVAENIVYKNEMKRGVFFDYKKNIKVVEDLSKRYMLPSGSKCYCRAMSSRASTTCRNIKNTLSKCGCHYF